MITHNISVFCRIHTIPRHKFVVSKSSFLIEDKQLNYSLILSTRLGRRETRRYSYYKLETGGKLTLPPGYLEVVLQSKWPHLRPFLQARGLRVSGRREETNWNEL